MPNQLPVPAGWAQPGCGRRRPEPGLGEGVGVQAASVDLELEELLQPHVAETNLTAEVVEQGELTRLGGGL